jgi:hypothetical protein
VGAGLGTALADGEAGILIQVGDAVQTFCIQFSGDGIDGDDLLSAAGLSYEQFGGGSGRAVCAIEDTGCQDAGSIDDCFCQCSGSECVYWAFFVREYGERWAYSALAFNLVRAGDGDVHGWKWGAGGRSSAPAPADSITFEQICGHAPRGAPATAAATPTPRSPGAPSTAPASSPEPAPAEAESAVSELPSGTPATLTVTAAAGRPSPTPTPSPAPPAAGEPGQDGGGGGPGAGSIAAFSLVAVALIAAIGAGLSWRARRGA